MDKKTDRKIKLLMLPTNCSGVNYLRMGLFFKQFAKMKDIDVAMYGYDPKDNKCARWEYEFARDVEGKGVRDQVYNLLRNCDIAIMGFTHYAAMPPLVEAFVSKKSEVVTQTFGPKKMVCEIDDWVIDTPSYNPAYKQGFKPGNENEYIPILHMMTSTAVVNATPWLAEKHKQYNPNSVCMPNVIDFEWWNVKPTYKKNQGKKDVVRIGWCGGGNHDEDLRIIPVLNRELQQKYGNKVEIVIVHGVPEYLKGIKGIKTLQGKWIEIEQYPQFLADFKFDIVIAPLEVNKFNCGKSNLKWLEACALKLPFVGSNCESYKAIEQGVDGFKCSTISEWMTCLSALIESPAMRKSIGANGYARIFKDFNVVDWSNKYIEFLKGLK